MSDLQDKVADWADRTFPNANRQTILCHLADELIEICGPFIVSSALSKWAHKQEDHPNAVDIREEAADIGLLLMHLAHKEGFSLEESEKEKFEKCKQRSWHLSDERGVHHHK